MTQVTRQRAATGYVAMGCKLTLVPNMGGNLTFGDFLFDFTPLVWFDFTPLGYENRVLAVLRFSMLP